MEMKLYNYSNRENEYWKKINLPDIKKNIYMLSNYGRVFSLVRKKIVSPFKDKDGYLKYTLQSENGGKKKIFSHRLVGMVYLTLPSNYKELTINHKNGIHDDNYYDNLEWATQLENIKHSWDIGLQHPVSCDKHGRATLRNEDVEKICELIDLGFTNKEIRNYMGYSKLNKLEEERYRGVIKHIKSGKTWREISKKYKFVQNNVDIGSTTRES